MSNLLGTVLSSVAARSGLKLSRNTATELARDYHSLLISTLLKEKKLSIPDFGTFKVVDKPARNGRNPKTGEALIIPAKQAVKFTPAKALKDRAAGKEVAAQEPNSADTEKE